SCRTTSAIPSARATTSCSGVARMMTTRWSGPWSVPEQTTSSPSCRMASTPHSPASSAGWTCPAASGSGSRWLGRRMRWSAALAADRRGVFVSGLLGILAWIAVPLQAVAIKLFIDAGGRGDATGLALAAIALSVVLGGMWYVNSLRQLLRVTVSERTHHELD